MVSGFRVLEFRVRELGLGLHLISLLRGGIVREE